MPFYPVSVSSDTSIQEAFQKDSLCYNGWLRVRFYYELTKTSKMTLNNLFHIKTPILVLQGTETNPVDPKSAQKLYDGVASKDKTIKEYSNYHEQLFENLGQPANDVIEWLRKRR
jgi:esterase/lipase